MNLFFDRIVVNSNICFGKPCIKGTRIWVSLILDFLSNGMGVKEIIDEYPQLTEKDIYAAIAYGAEMTRERYVEIPMGVVVWGAHASSKCNTCGAVPIFLQCLTPQSIL